MSRGACVGRLAAGLLVLVAVGCAGIEEVEGGAVPPPADLGEGFTNPGAREGQYELDSDLCWQEIEPSSPTERAMNEAWLACMRERGWTQAP